ncbi:uracil-DNA glycosylase [Marivivens aquimaris]|uniref:uracil-DNA glycosylase n=1 Tax=Marivivens aquimaris TaxID=2774876 RepID=UPI00187E041D|nr:uracil-DNA glycosylase [Marivivens aquimaris]
MDSAVDYWTARALLEWQVELGVDEAILDTPVDRFEKVEEPAVVETKPKGPPVPPQPVEVDPAQEATAAASAAVSREALGDAMQAFEHCELKLGAKNFVFCDGNPDARVMIIGEAPGREEDLAGKPFVGRAGHLLDKMFGCIGLTRNSPDPAKSIYITNVMPWRPPANRTPDAKEIAMMLPFLKRHVELVSPDFIVLMGNTPCQALLGKGGITRIRGNWTEALGKPVLPMFHPAYLLRQPLAKREAWADLLDLSARLED